MIARCTDGLPLATSIEGGDDQHDQNMTKYTSQAKLLFRKLQPDSPKKCTLESGPYVFHYYIEQGACFLVLCEKNFPPKVAFAFLEDIAREFISQYGGRIDTVARPYHFIEFDAYIQSSKKKFVDRQSRGQLHAVHSELQDVQRIMVQNIEDVIHRGEALNILDDKAAGLSVLSKKYKQDARYLNLRSSLMKIGLIIILVVLFLLYVRFYWW